MARPTKLTDEIRDEICERLASGESLRSICGDERLPVMSTVLLWVVNDRDGFSEHYSRAREAAGYAHADRLVDVVDRVSAGEYDPNQARAMLDGLKWAAERMAPKAHSQKVQQEHTGKDGGPIETQTSIDPSGLSEQALSELMAVKTNDANAAAAAASETASEPPQSDAGPSPAEAAETLQAAFDEHLDDMQVKAANNHVWFQTGRETQDEWPYPGGDEVFSVLTDSDLVSYVHDGSQEWADEPHKLYESKPGEWWKNALAPDDVEEYISEVLE